MARIKLFPEVIFVRVEADRNDDDVQYLVANLTKRDALDGETKAVVGLYKFVEAHEVQEGPTLAKKRRSRATA